ncbi:MAG: electron transfer flavoprotein subunit alpha/FixB family protein [Thermaerobacter sp.]|nr:electron transfer flavoprotein subunit alpha/FixB family protein [Thermaerobacter sp.]
MILAVLEAQDGALKKISYEVLTAAKKTDEALSAGGVTALLIGPGAQQAAQSVPGNGVQQVLYAEGDAFAAYAPQAYAQAVLAAAQAASAQAVVFGATAFGRDVAPRVAAARSAGLLMDVTELFAKDGSLAARRPVYAGKAIAVVQAVGQTAVAAVRPNAFAAQAAEEPFAPAKALGVDVDPVSVRAKVREVRRESAGRAELSEADVVVSGGRGLKEPENFTLLEELADALGAAVGATRAVVDAGWRPHHEQVGQTGKTVSPGLYFAVGISGAVQHIAGMSSSRTIVAINRDAEAPIFKIADYGVVGDALEILPQLTQEVRRIKG